MIYLAFYAEKDRMYNRRREHELGRLLLAFGLKREYGIEREDIRILTESGGKPYLDGYPGIYFNISHCDGAAVCAVHDNLVGVDIEKVRPYTEALVRKTLTAGEARQLADQPEHRREACFIRYWTLKESYQKARGEGIAKPLTEISFQWDRKGKVSSSDPDYFHAVCTVRGKYQIAVSIKQREGKDYDISGSF